MDSSKWFIERSRFYQQKYFKTPLIKSNLGDYSDEYIIVKRTTSLKTNGNNDMPPKD